MLLDTVEVDLVILVEDWRRLGIVAGRSLLVRCCMLTVSPARGNP